MTQDQKTQHTPGPLAIFSFDDDGHAFLMAPGADGGVFVANAGGDNVEMNKRLLAAAYTSYDKHCGPRAVECAEADLLGEALKALRGVIAVADRKTDEFDRAKAVLAKASGERT